MKDVKLTPKQKAFADYYIELGNATQAAKKAGYSEKTAFAIGRENIHKPAIAEYISERMAEIDKKRVATADEVIKFYSSVMRGEEKDSFGMDASLADRLKAADSLMKRYAISADKKKETLDRLGELLKEMKNAAVEQ